MSVSTVEAGVIRIGDGVATVFPFSFEAKEPTEIKVSNFVNETLVPVTSGFVVVVEPNGVGGTVTFAVAPTSGLSFYIYRNTTLTQLVSVSSQQKYDPEVIEAVWDKLTFIVQELSAEAKRAVKTVPGLDPTVLISDLLQAATDATNAAASAAASAASAAAKDLSMLRDRGNWASLVLYNPSDIVSINGSSYICVVSHFAGVFATDLAAVKWRIFAAKGDAGVGTGDMLKTENLSGLTDVPLARTNLGLGALASKGLAAFADIDPSAVVSDVEGLAGNKIANAIPVAKAVTDYVDNLLPVRRAYVPTVIGNIFDVTSIQSGVSRMRLTFRAISLTGAEDILVQLGTSGGLMVTGYTGSSIYLSTGGSGRQYTTGLGFYVSSASRNITGHVDFTRVSGNEWVASYKMRVTAADAMIGGSEFTLPGELTQLRVTRTGTIPGAISFDNGGFALEYSV